MILSSLYYDYQFLELKLRLSLSISMILRSLYYEYQFLKLKNFSVSLRMSMRWRGFLMRGGKEKLLVMPSSKTMISFCSPINLFSVLSIEEKLDTGNEVGRSCVYISCRGQTIMFDCGIHPAYSGMAALPFFDEIDPSTTDVLLITRFHLDHAASLPYFLEKTTFK